MIEKRLHDLCNLFFVTDSIKSEALPEILYIQNCTLYKIVQNLRLKYLYILKIMN